MFAVGRHDGVGPYSRRAWAALAVLPLRYELSRTSLVRGDIVYFSTKNVGAQFSSSSTSWVSSLQWNAYSNDVAAMTVNVIKRFAQDGPLDDI